MKPTFPTIIALAAFAPGLQAQSNWGTSANVSVNLTVSWSSPSLPKKDEFGVVVRGEDAEFVFENEFTVTTVNTDGETTRSSETYEYGSKLASYRWSTRDILLFLVGDDEDPDFAPVLPRKGRAPFIAGWSLIRVTDSEGEVSYYARHTDKTTVALEDLSLGLNAVGDQDTQVSAETGSAKSVVTTIFDLSGEGNDRETASYAYSRSFKGLGVANALLGTSLPGLLTGSERAVLKTERVRDLDTGVTETFSTYVTVPGALKLDRIVAYDGDDELPGVVEGSVSVAGATIQNLDTFLVFDEEEPIFE